MREILRERIRAGRAALIIVDVQNDFCHPEGAIARAGRDISPMRQMVPTLLRFIEEGRRARLPIIYLKTHNDPWTRSRSWASRDREGEEVVFCQTESWGAEFYKVSPREDERVIIKHRYSGFVGTDLDLILRTLGMETLIITGVATNVCVESTARDGFMRDYCIVLVSDCTATHDLEAHQATLRNIERYFGIVAGSQEITQMWREVET